jgi:hypothetical protein
MHHQCPRRGGSGAGWRGDACVALGGRVSHLHVEYCSGMQGMCLTLGPRLESATSRPARLNLLDCRLHGTRLETPFRISQLGLWQFSETEWLLVLRGPGPAPHLFRKNKVADSEASFYVQKRIFRAKYSCGLNYFISLRAFPLEEYSRGLKKSFSQEDTPTG